MQEGVRKWGDREGIQMNNKLTYIFRASDPMNVGKMLHL